MLTPDTPRPPYQPQDGERSRYYRSVQGCHMRDSQRRDGDLECNPDMADCDLPYNSWYQYDAHGACFCTLGGGGGVSPHTRTAIGVLTYGEAYLTEEGKEMIAGWHRLAQGRDITVTRRPENNPSFFRVRATEDLVTVEFIPQVVYASNRELSHGDADVDCAFKMDFTLESVGDAAKFQALRLLPIAMLLDYGRQPAPSTVVAVYPPDINWRTCVHDRGNWKVGRNEINDAPYTL